MLKKTSDLGLFELYRKNPGTADQLLFCRETNSDRRGFLRGAGLATMSAMVGASSFHIRNSPDGAGGCCSASLSARFPARRAILQRAAMKASAPTGD